MKASIELVRKIWDDEEGVCIEVGPSADNPDWIEISTRDAKSKEYFGEINLALPAGFARLLGQSLLAATEPVS